MTKPAAETSVNMQYVRALAGIHHLKLPVIDLARSCEWYRSRLGYKITMKFVEQGKLMGYALGHPPGPAARPRPHPGSRQLLLLRPRRARQGCHR
jgi:catechol 2,3-dioxygenase-like lactoylglutathione lyase family enzyme